MPNEIAMSSRKIVIAILAAVLSTPVLLLEARHSRTPKDSNAIVLVGAGDIADCADLAGAEATAKLLEKIPGTVIAIGDLAYPDGSRENFTCYNKTWGRVKDRT